MPTVENSQITTPASSTNTRTLASYAVGNNANRLLLAGLVSFSSSEPHEPHASVVFNTSENFTKVAEQLQGNDDYKVSLWKLLAPSVATEDIVASTTGNVGVIALCVVSIHGVDQTTPLGTAAKNTALTGDHATVDVASAAGELVIDFSLSEYGVNTHGAGQDENSIENTGWGFTSSRKAGAATVTMNENLAESGASWVIMGISVKPVSSPPAPVYGSAGDFDPELIASAWFRTLYGIKELNPFKNRRLRPCYS